MSTPKTHYIPHPLITLDPKALEVWFKEFAQQKESLKDYIKNSINPRWAAYHIVKALKEGFGQSSDTSAYKTLQECAENLFHTVRDTTKDYSKTYDTGFQAGVEAGKSEEKQHWIDLMSKVADMIYQEKQCDSQRLKMDQLMNECWNRLHSQ